MSNADKIAKLEKEMDKAPWVDGAIAEKEPKISINKYHEEIGHSSFVLTRATENIEISS